MAFFHAPELRVPYVLTGPDGSRAVFNDETDPDYVGVLSDLTGMDSPEVRESGDVIVAFDGGVNGPHYFGRRPVVAEGLIYGHATAAQRSAKMDKLIRASTAMRDDATLTWTPSGGEPLVLGTLRRQQPLRFMGAWNKGFQLSLIAADPRVYSDESFTVEADTAEEFLYPENLGSAETFPTYVLGGPMEAPTIHNYTSGRNLVLGDFLDIEDVLYIDTMRRTIMRAQRGFERYNDFEDPSLERTTNPYLISHLNCTVAANQAQPTPSSGWGTNVTKLTATASANMYSYAKLKRTAAIERFPVRDPSKPITVSFSSLAAGTPELEAIIQVTWLTAGGATIDTDLDDAGASSNSAWTRHVYTTPTPPPLAHQCEVAIGFYDFTTTTIPNGTAWYVDGIMVENDDTDGSFAMPTLTPAWVWAGTTNQSASFKYNRESDPTVDLEPAFELLDFDTSRWTGLAVGQNELNVTEGGTPLWDADSFFRVEWRHAWL